MSEKTYCPAKCGKLFITKEHAYTHADKEHPNWDKPELQKRKGWATPYGFIDFAQPVTYKEACEQMKKLSEPYFANQTNNKKED